MCRHAPRGSEWIKRISYETIAVMGYDDQEIAQHLSPALSTVLPPHRETGQWANLALLGDSPVRQTQARMDCPVVLRASRHITSQPPARKRHLITVRVQSLTRRNMRQIIMRSGSSIKPASRERNLAASAPLMTR